ncbi:mycothiol synthase [soil metagenome]
MHDLRLRRELDPASLTAIRHLLEDTTRIEGHAPIGEHKLAHLTPGAQDWDGILAYAGDRLIGYAHLRWNPAGSNPRVAVEVVVHPDHREEGVQAALLDATRTTVANGGGGRMFLWVHRVEDPTDTLAFRMGFRIQRQLAYMRRPATPVPDAPTLPNGVTVRPYAGPADDSAFLEVNNAAFADHPENGGWDHAEFTARRSLPWFDPDGLFMAFAEDGKPFGFHWTKWHVHEGDDHAPHDPYGEVYVLAVHPRAQGLGLGRSLLRIGMRHLAARADQIVLYVDCAEEGPVALYRSEGFDLRYREVCFVDEVAPAGGPATRELLRPAG